MPFPEVVETTRLNLRRPGPQDEDSFLSVWADRDVWQSLRPGEPFDPGHGAVRFQHHLHHWEVHGFGLWMIRDRATGDTGGWVGPSHPDFVDGLAGEIEIGWSLRQPFQGRGLATEGARAAVSAAQAHLHPERLISLIDPGNARSIAVARRLGMRDVGPVEHRELGLALRVYALEPAASPR